MLLCIDRRFRLGPGRLFSLYLMGYGTGRFWIEGLRIDATEAADVAGLRWNQWVALAAVVGGAVWFARTRDRRWPEPAPAGEMGDAPVDEVAPVDGVDGGEADSGAADAPEASTTASGADPDGAAPVGEPDPSD